MEDLPNNANIVDEKGVFYQVTLTWVPRVGELIDLYSHVDQADNNQSRHHYEVLQVVHLVHDVTNKVQRSLKGAHFVTIHVRRSANKFFTS